MLIARMNKGSWNKVIAFFDVETIEGFTIKGFKLVEGPNGRFVGYPSEKKEDEWIPTTWANEELKIELINLAKHVYEHGVDNQPGHKLEHVELSGPEYEEVMQQDLIQAEPPSGDPDEKIPF